jgi:phage-related minor tail protein
MAASRSLGQLTLDLVTRIAGFTGPLDKAGRELDKKMSAMEKRAYAFGKVIGGTLKVGFGLAAAATGLFIKNTIEAEKVQAQLAARIKDTAGAAGRSLQQLNDQADKLQGLTVFDDEAIGGVQAMLLTFKQIQGVNFDDATAAVLDLSTAMGTDLNSASVQLGKALNDPIKGITALAKAGIQFSEDQKKVIKALVETGDIAGAQRVILKELEGQMGSAAEAARNTLGGALQGLKNSFDNLLEGDSDSEGVRGATDAINDLSGAMNDPDVKEGVQNIVGGIASIVAQCVEGIGALERFASNVNTVFDISEKVSSGAPVSAFTDRELEVRLANLSTQKSKANKAGDTAEVKRLQALITEAIRENTARINKKIFDGVTSTFDTTYGADPAKSTKPTGGGGGRSKADDSKRQAEEAARALREAGQAQDDWHQKILDMQADLAGPAAVAVREFDKTLGELSAEYAAGKITLADYATAEELAAQVRDKALASVPDLQAAVKNQIADMEFELHLLGLSNIEREKEIALRYAGADATEEQRARIAGLVEEMDKAAKVNEFWSDTQNAMSDAFFDFATGAKSAKDALGDFLDAIYSSAVKAASEYFSEQITNMFKAQGGSGASGSSGGSGGWGELFGFIGGLFGGGRVNGGPVVPGKFYEVGEQNRPEMLFAGGKQYMIPGNAGNVVPIRGGGGGGGFTQNNQFIMGPQDKQSTQEQIAGRIGYASNEAMRRNGR